MISWFTAWLATMGIQSSHLIAGIAGGIIRALVNKNGSIWERIVAGFVGTLIAAFFTPLVLFVFGITAPQFGAAVGFMLGMLGMSFAEALIAIGKDYAKNPGKLKDEILGFFLKMLTKRDDK